MYISSRRDPLSTLDDNVVNAFMYSRTSPSGFQKYPISEFIKYNMRNQGIRTIMGAYMMCTSKNSSKLSTFLACFLFCILQCRRFLLVLKEIIFVKFRRNHVRISEVLLYTLGVSCFMGHDDTLG